jgi:hypothetical protein
MLLKNHDVHELNKMQFLNADEYIITTNPDDEDYLQSIDSKLAKFKNKELIFENLEFYGKGQEILTPTLTGLSRIRYSPHFSFIEKREGVIRDVKRTGLRQRNPVLGQIYDEEMKKWREPDGENSNLPAKGAMELKESTPPV